MPRLKSRQHFPPVGFRFYQPETKWASTEHASFDVTVNEIISHRQGQPHLAQKNGWAMDYGSVADELDNYVASKCQAMGFNAFVQEGGGASALSFTNSPPPPPTDPSKLSAAASSVKKIWQGVKTVDQWFEVGSPAVPAELSTSRAKHCIDCPKHGEGDFTSWFTIPASEKIKSQVEKAKGLNLSTPYDDRLKVCQVCLCPMALKCHFPIEIINAHLTDEVRNELAAVGCWITKEVFA